MIHYSSILKDYIEESSLSLSQIESQLRKRGFNKNKSYLSNLQNGKIDPPSLDVTYALASIVGGDPIRLFLAPILEYLTENKTNDIEGLNNSLDELIITTLAIYSNANFTYGNYGIEEIDGSPIGFEASKNLLSGISSEEILGKIGFFAEGEIKETERESEDVSPGHITLSVNQDEESYLLECLELYRKHLKKKFTNE